MAQLQFAVNHQIISRTDNFKPVAESKNYLYAHFTFETDEWSDVVATAIFRNDTAAKEVLIDQNGDCLVPWEIIQNNGDVIYVSCFAGDLITVNMARVRIYETGYGDDLESATPPTPSVYAQIIDRMDGIETAVENATERTEAAAELAAEAVAHYPKIEDNYWYVWDAENEEFVNTGVRAEAEDGTSATVVVTPITNGHRVTITDAEGDHVFDVMDGASSTISVSNITGGHRLTITDKNGTRTVDVMDGTKGNDGYSPTVSITDIPGGYNVTITDKSGAHSYNILNGAPGAPGFSPIVSTTAITGGHKITIQDKYQTQYFDVMDGSDYVLTQQDKQDIADLVDVPGATFHICVSGEYDPTTRVPTIQDPQGDVFYLVPSTSATSPDMFTEWIWTNNAWEMFGSATIDLSNYVQKTDYASDSNAGVMKIGSGVTVNANGFLYTVEPTDNQIKAGTISYTPIPPKKQHQATFYGMAKAAGDDTQSQSSNPVGTYTDAAKMAILNMLGSASVSILAPIYDATDTYDLGEYVIYDGLFYRCTTAIATAEAWNAAHWTLATIGEVLFAIPPGGTTGQVLRKQSNADFIANWTRETVTDVQINGTTILDSDGVANVPYGTGSVAGVAKSSSSTGVTINASGYLLINNANETQLKEGTSIYRPVTPSNQHLSAFYGLAKVAGSNESDSTLPLGQYTENAKSAISAMLNAPESKSGTTVSITAKSGIRYVCGEVATLDIVVPASGLFEVDFESGSTATVLTTTGTTVVWPNWFDPTALEADTLYEISIQDGKGLVATWPA